MVLLLSPTDTDTSLSQRVAFALNSFAGHQMREVQCSAEGRTVLLEGSVASFYQKQLAQTIARKTHGVGRVRNHIEVVRS